MKTFPSSERAVRFSAVLFIVFLSAVAIPARTLAQSGGYGVAVPSELVLTVRETAGIARSGEVVRSGVPMPRSLGVTSLDRLALVDGAGRPVPAEFQALARWNAGRDDAAAPVQWLLVTFPATVGARASAAYRLVTDGSAGPNPAPARALILVQNGNEVTVDTGAAVFRLGADPGTLFDEVRTSGGARLVTGSTMSARAAGADVGHSRTRRVVIEHAGPLAAAVVIDGQFDLAPVGNGGLGSQRRYLFTAGSPTAVVRQSFAWEGNLACNGCVETSDGTAVNGLFVERVRDALALGVGGPLQVTAAGELGAPSLAGTVPAGGSAAVRQLLRSSRTAPLAFEVQVGDAGGNSTTGVKADGALLAASGPAGTVGIALSHMHRYEPQALRLLPDGRLAVDLVDGKAWLAHHQGLFATLAVTAVAGTPSRAELDRLLWAPLNKPLRAWPTAAWFGSSDAVEEFPVGILPGELAGYDTLVRSVLTRTLDQVDVLGLAGLGTFGVYPRYWGKAGTPGEINCGGDADPTPADDWDDLFWCGTFTDYHNTVATAPIWAMRSGEVEWLDEIAFPGALRTLHTQIMQCSPDQFWFYCGQAPAGYGGYRRDFNSSHAYFDNLFLYYWLTGDGTVVDVLRRGGENMRRRMCDLRGPANVKVPTGPGGPPCPPTRPLGNASLVGRVASQWLSVYRFLGLASPDASFLDDFRMGIGRGLTQEYAELVRNGVAYGFLSEEPVGDASTQHTTGSTWTNSNYDANNIFRLQRDTGDAPVGEPALRPSAVLAAWARTMCEITPTLIGDGMVTGEWPRLIAYTGSGVRIGGELLDVQDGGRGIYTPEKAGANALLVRAGQQSSDSGLVDFGRQDVMMTLGAATREGVPLGKLQGQYLTRLHPAVARLAGVGAPEPPPPPPPPPTPAPVAPSDLVAGATSSSAIELTWQDNSSDEQLFAIEQMVGGSFAEVQTVPAGTTRASVTGLSPATSYSFRVRASGPGGYSAYSNTATAVTQAPPPPPPPPTAVPNAPSDLVAKRSGSKSMMLTWKDNSNDETAFHVERLAAGVVQQVYNVGASVTTYRVNGLSSNASQSFRVRASNANGYSAYSNTASENQTVQPPSPSPASVPSAPSDLSAQKTGRDAVMLSWKDRSNDETTFQIEWLVGGVVKEVYSTDAGVTSYRIRGLQLGVRQSFRVRAGNARGYSAYSNTATVLP